MNKKEWGFGIGAIVALAVGSSVFYNSMHSEVRTDSVKEQSIFQRKESKKESLEERLTGVYAHNGVYVEVYSKGENNSKLVYKIDLQNKIKYSGLGPVYLTIPGADRFEKAGVSLDPAVEHQTLTFNYPQKLNGKEMIIYAEPEGNYFVLDRVKLGGK